MDSTYVPAIVSDGVTQSRGDHLLDVEGLGVSFGPRRVLADITFSVPAQGVTVLMGPGGAGKSTLLHWLSDLPKPSRRSHRGRVSYLGAPIERATRRPALMQQQARDLLNRLGDMLAASLREHMQASPAQLREVTLARLHRLDLKALASVVDTRVADLSPVEIRIACLLRAAFTDRPLLMLDEPTYGLAQRDAECVLSLIERLGRECACLVTTHNQLHARQIAHRAILLAGGRIQANAPASDFFSNPDRHPVLGQFLRTGSCSVPGLDAEPETLDNAVVASSVAQPFVKSTHADGDPDVGRATASPDEEPAVSLAPATSVIQPAENAPPNSLGPSGFHWLVPGRLAGCPKPGVVHAVDHDLALLRRMGITMLINLTEHPFPQDALARHGLKGYALHVEDRRAPPLLWAKLLLAKMERFMRDGEVLAVHCLAGLGRTGTILCCWLIKEGLTAEEALRRVRSLDRGFVQSEEQEQLLRDLENNLLIRAK